MDKKKILDEGWLEQYAMGTLNAKDMLWLENSLSKDEELRENLKDIEESLEKMSLENTLEVPKEVKSRLLNSIDKTSELPLKESEKKATNLPFMMAASIAALLMIGCFYLYSEMKNIEENVNIVRQENLELKKQLDNTTEVIAETNNWFGIITDEATDKYTLIGNDLAPDAKLTSYVNHKTKTVALHTHKLPKLDENHDYQMWADVRGEMINMGIIPKNKDLIAMRYIESAESLNITIEPAGGNDHPTVERLISNVYLK